MRGRFHFVCGRTPSSTRLACPEIPRATTVAPLKIFKTTLGGWDRGSATALRRPRRKRILRAAAHEDGPWRRRLVSARARRRQERIMQLRRDLLGRALLAEAPPPAHAWPVEAHRHLAQASDVPAELQRLPASAARSHSPCWATSGLRRTQTSRAQHTALSLRHLNRTMNKQASINRARHLSMQSRSDRVSNSHYQGGL